VAVIAIKTPVAGKMKMKITEEAPAVANGVPAHNLAARKEQNGDRKVLQVPEEAAQ